MNESFELLGNGLVCISALWVGWACIWRLNLMRRGIHQGTQIAAYTLTALWAAAELLGLKEFTFIGIVGVALLFWGGRDRWLVKAPTDTERG